MVSSCGKAAMNTFFLQIVRIRTYSSCSSQLHKAKLGRCSTKFRKYKLKAMPSFVTKSVMVPNENFD